MGILRREVTLTEDLKEYYLQRQTKAGQWKEVVKSYEYESLIYAGTQRKATGEVCRVIDNSENVLWQAEDAPISEGAKQNG